MCAYIFRGRSVWVINLISLVVVEVSEQFHFALSVFFAQVDGASSRAPGPLPFHVTAWRPRCRRVGGWACSWPRSSISPFDDCCGAITPPLVGHGTGWSTWWRVSTLWLVSYSLEVIISCPCLPMEASSSRAIGQGATRQSCYRTRLTGHDI